MVIMVRLELKKYVEEEEGYIELSLSAARSFGDHLF